MNYTSFIVKVIKNPEQIFFRDNIFVTQMIVKFIPSKKKTLNIIDNFQISVWGNLSSDKTNFYQIDDYLIIEGYIYVHSNISNTKTKQVEISVLKIYPFLLI